MRDGYTWKNEQLSALAGCLLEGKTYAEAGEEFGYSERWVRKKMKDIQNFLPIKYDLIQNKPYMAFQRMVYTGCSLKEARDVWRVSEERFNKFMSDVFKTDFSKYISMKTKIYNASKKR